MWHNGWYQVAFERELVSGINEVRLNSRPIMLLLEDAGLRAYDATCPHRGANLCRGGTIEHGSIRCPFHGLSISLGGQYGGLVAREWPCLMVGGLVFIRHPEGRDAGFSEQLTQLDARKYIVPGFSVDMAVKAELVIENAFDALHFQTVHCIGNRPMFRAVEEQGGAFSVEGEFLVPRSQWQDGKPDEETVMVPFRATAYSPTVVLSEMAGDAPYAMLTATNPTGPRSCTIRLSLIVSPQENEAAPSASDCQYLLEGALRGLREDQQIWEGIADDAPFSSVPGDEQVKAFRNFAQTFRPCP